MKKIKEDIPQKKERKYLPTLSDLLDRLTIVTLKECLIPDKKDEYSKEVEELVHDIDLIMEEQKVKINGKFIRVLVVLAQMNSHIWNNETNYRKNGNKDGCDLALTHQLNGLRNQCKNILQTIVGVGRKDYKTDQVGELAKNYEPKTVWN